MKTNFLSLLKDWENVAVSVLRMAIGWHFLYEGVAKVMLGGWSAQSYLANTTGALSPFYHWIAASPAIGVVDWLNIVGLLAIGLALFLGCFTRAASVAGALLLILYYFAYPPFGLSLLVSSGESHLYIVNYQMFEALALAFLACRADTGFGIGKWLGSRLANRKENVTPAGSRREAIKHLASIPALGLIGWGAYENSRRYGVDVMSGATIQLNRQDLSELKGALPKGKIGKHEISRMVLGGNLIGGWSHGRDLLYTDQLFKAYNTERKVYETLMLAEAAGINSINIGFPSNELLRKYKKATGSKIKVITQIAADVKDESTLFNDLYAAIDFGVDIIQIQGNWVDWMTRDNHVDRIGRLLGKIREEGFTAGLGAHTIDSLIACRDAGIIPDYYMKTMHHDRYWSAHPRENRIPFEQDGPTSLDHNKYHNNLFCPYPDRTTEFVAQSPVPVMGFKVLAAGAIHPSDGIYWAFEHGADFVCVGMFDFQIVEDVNLCIDILHKLENDGARARAWA
ncbi:MAG: DoxX family protein [Tannerellaceae bacterium]|jgi:uncharacterized membrane protein YphA (DoxX/SURF4 family)|nr:DoxX family protein [Tannerellaceae bacterium]